MKFFQALPPAANFLKKVGQKLLLRGAWGNFSDVPLFSPGLTLL
jgi:hypothetical protein